MPDDGVAKDAAHRRSLTRRSAARLRVTVFEAAARESQAVADPRDQWTLKIASVLPAGSGADPGGEPLRASVEFCWHRSDGCCADLRRSAFRGRRFAQSARFHTRDAELVWDRRKRPVPSVCLGQALPVPFSERQAGCLPPLWRAGVSPAPPNRTGQRPMLPRRWCTDGALRRPTRCSYGSKDSACGGVVAGKMGNCAGSREMT